MAYVMEFVDKLDDQDQVFESNNIKLVIDNATLIAKKLSKYS